jgi:uncharacterized DUF497 family protein
MSLRFIWNEDKAQVNVQKHGITFEEAQTVFGDSVNKTLRDLIDLIPERPSSEPQHQGRHHA